MAGDRPYSVSLDNRLFRSQRRDRSSSAILRIGRTDVNIDISVIIPTFRRPRELNNAILSVLGQDDATVEVVVVDDSPEGSAEAAVRGLQDLRVVYLRNPNPTGGIPSIVRNIGWPMARGTFVHFLDDDDIVAEGHYAAVKTAFDANPNIGVVFGRVAPFGNGPAAQLDHERRYFADAARKAALSGRFGSRFAFTGRMLFDRALLVCSASVIRRQCLARIGGFDPSIRLMEDADYHVRAMRHCGALFLDRAAVRYRVGSPSLMHSPSSDRNAKAGRTIGTPANACKVPQGARPPRILRSGAIHQDRPQDFLRIAAATRTSCEYGLRRPRIRAGLKPALVRGSNPRPDRPPTPRLWLLWTALSSYPYAVPEQHERQRRQSRRHPSPSTDPGHVPVRDPAFENTPHASDRVLVHTNATPSRNLGRFRGVCPAAASSSYETRF